MIEREVDVTTRFGAMPTFIACADSTRHVPAVIFFMDAWGMREELKNMARRIAKEGYFCMLADLYYRYGQVRFDLTKRHDGMATVMRAAYHNLTDDNVRDDVAAMLGYLAAQPQVRSGPIGTVGYCMGGRFITNTARQFPEQIAAGVSICGTRLVTDQPDSPHLHLDGIKARLYYAFGEQDHTTPPNYISSFQSALEASGLSFGVDTYAGAEHGYCFAERAAYQPKASEASWSKLFELYRRTLI